jgi:hypothetical protein
MPWRPGSAGGKVWDTVLDLPGSGSEVPAGVSSSRRDRLSHGVSDPITSPRRCGETR